MRIGVILERHQPVLDGMLDRLAAAGAIVEVIEPATAALELGTLRPASELYVLKSLGTPAGGAIAAAFHALGAPTFNPFPVVSMLHDKVSALARLARAGVPVPETHVAGNPRALLPLLETGPLVVKPFRGSRGVGVRVIRSASELLAFPAPAGEPTLVQRYHPGDDGLDRKIFVVDHRVFGVRRRFPLRRYEDKLGEPFRPDEELLRIARRIGEDLGLDLYSFDVVVSGGRPWVVDVGSFGSFMGVPDAPRMLADRVLRAWREVA
ncbi:MAG: hypothetical protein HY907_03720 [Deltaproteobacteria bacterium]|nr:hypothetical protein [Deltaproteobacteria bacterium]